jgi:hypothetical protein
LVVRWEAGLGLQAVTDPAQEPEPIDGAEAEGVAQDGIPDMIATGSRLPVEQVPEFDGK